jgi:hypothetical protein
VAYGAGVLGRGSHALFGAPEAVAARHTLTSKAHAHMASWLRAGEAMLRRLIAIEAAAYPKPNTRPLLHTIKLFGRKRVRKLRYFTAEKPEAWRVSFRCFHSSGLSPSKAKPPPTALRQAQGSRRKRLSREERWCAEHQPRVSFHSAWPLAERYEALIRVFNDPTAYARRLSRRLHATPHRLSEVLRTPPEAPDRIDRFEALGAQARNVWDPHFSSG